MNDAQPTEDLVEDLAHQAEGRDPDPASEPAQPQQPAEQAASKEDPI